MKNEKTEHNKSDTSFDLFKELACKLVSVPKAEIDKREAAYQRKQAKKTKRGPKPRSA